MKVRCAFGSRLVQSTGSNLSQVLQPFVPQGTLALDSLGRNRKSPKKVRRGRTIRRFEPDYSMRVVWAALSGPL